MNYYNTSRWTSLLIVSSAAFLSVIDIFIVNVALPSIKKGIGGSDADIQLVIALYLLGYAAFLITGGRAGDHYGKKGVFITGMLFFTITSCLCGFAQTPFQMNAARFLQGISAAFMVPQSIAYIHVLFPDHRERIKALGIYGSIAGTASVIGQLLGGILPDTHFITAGWRLIFLINLPVGLIAIALAAKYLHNTPPGKKGRFDLSGVALLTTTLICLIFPLVYGRELHWPLWSLLMLIAAVLLLCLFVFDQRKKLAAFREPLINMQLFRYRDFNIGLAAVLFYFMVQDSYFIINAILLQTGLGLSSSATGILFVFQGVGYVIASLFAIRLIKKYGKKVLQAGVLLMMCMLVLHIVFFNTVSLPREALLVILFMYGMGCGAVLPSLLTITLKSVPAHFAGAASGTYTTFQQTAIALGVGITGGIFFYLANNAATPAIYIHAYVVATVVNIVLLLLVSVCLFILPET